MRPVDRGSELHKHIRARGIIGNSALGVSDGLITNLAFLSGFAAAIQDLHLIQVAGLASMIAGAISMFFGGFLAGRSEYELFEADARREKHEIELEPEEEKSELRDFYIAKGLTSAEADNVVARIASDKDKFLEDLLMHELKLHRARLESPFKVGLVLGASFLAGALIPLLPFLILPTRTVSIIVAAIVSALFLFLVGGWKGRVVGRGFLVSGLETFLIGVAASAILYFIGIRLGVF